VLDALRAYSFPGNVRELENVLERALAFANDGVIQVGDLSLKAARPLEPGSREVAPAVAVVVEAAAPPVPVAALPLPVAAPPVEPVPDAGRAAPAAAAAPASEGTSTLPDYLDRIERDVIKSALQQAGSDHDAAAGLLGISVRQLRYQMQKLKM